jgi:hypothetical protein
MPVPEPRRAISAGRDESVPSSRAEHVADLTPAFMPAEDRQLVALPGPTTAPCCSISTGGDDSLAHRRLSTAELTPAFMPAEDRQLVPLPGSIAVPCPSALAVRYPLCPSGARHR